MSREHNIGLGDLFQVLDRLEIDPIIATYPEIKRIAATLGIKLNLRSNVNDKPKDNEKLKEERIRGNSRDIKNIPKLTTIVQQEFPLLTSIELLDNRVAAGKIKISEVQLVSEKDSETSEAQTKKFDPIKIPTNRISSTVPLTSIFNPLHESNLLIDLIAKLVEEGEINISSIIECLSSGEPIAHLPRLAVRSARNGIHVLIEDDQALTYYGNDLNHIITTLRGILDRTQVDIFWFNQLASFGEPWVLTEFEDDLKDYRLLNEKTPIFLFHSIGFTSRYDNDLDRIEKIVPFLAWAAEQSLPVYYFTVRHPDHLPKQILENVSPVFWHHNPSLKLDELQDSKLFKKKYEPYVKSFDRLKAAGATSWTNLKLAELLSLASEISPGLIREMRINHLPEAPTIIESELWFSELPKIRNPRGILLYKEDEELLRTFLSQDQKKAKYWDTLQRYRDNSFAPMHLKYDEEVAYLALDQEVNSASIQNKERIERIAGELMATVESYQDFGFQVWLSSTIREWPNEVKKLGSISALYHKVTGDTLTISTEVEEEIPVNYLSREVSIRVTNEAIYISDLQNEVSNYNHFFRVPDLDVVSLTIKQGESSAQKVLLGRGESMSFERRKSPSFTITTEFGEIFEIPIEQLTIVNIENGVIQFNAVRTDENLQELLPEVYSLFDHLPKNDIPEVRPVPIGSRVTYPPNNNFLGRENIIKKIANNISVATEQIRFMLLAGPSGVGKTSVANEIVNRYGYFFAGGVFWLNMSDPSRVPLEIIECGRALQIENFNNLEEKDKLAAVRQRWEEGAPCLIVLDSCHEAHHLKPYLPKKGQAKIIALTRQSASQFSDFNPILVELNTLVRQDSIELLRQILEESEVNLNYSFETLNRYADLLGDYPTAVQLVGAYLAHFNHDGFEKTLATIEARLSNDRSGSIENRHQQIVFASFNLIYEQVFDDSLALGFLILLSCFAPDTPLDKQILEAGFAELKDFPFGSGRIRAESQSLDELIEWALQARLLELIKLDVYMVRLISSNTIKSTVNLADLEAIQNKLAQRYSFKLAQIIEKVAPTN